MLDQGFVKGLGGSAMRRNRFGFFAFMAYGLLLGSGVWFSSASAETTGDRFRNVIADIDAWCKRNKIGPYLDKSDPEYRSKAPATDCNILKLEPRDWRGAKFVSVDGQPYPVPEGWLSTPEGKFAHSIKLPAPYDRAKEVYRPWMSAKSYFEALCREEAGEFIFQTVKDVEVVFEIRPREEARSEQFFHLFALKDPYGYVNGEIRKHIGAMWTSGDVYRALERASADHMSFERVFRRSISELDATRE